MQKKWFMMGMIFIFVFYLIGNLYAEEISLDYPKKVTPGEAFAVTINLNNFTDDIYDLKISVMDGTHCLSSVYSDSKWKSSVYWMTGAINTAQVKTQVFLINVTHEFVGTADLNIKIKSDSVSKEFNGNKINITSKTNIPPVINNQTITNNPPVINTTKPATQEISLGISWNDENIINGDEFKIKIDGFNLEDKKYDIRVYIFEDDENKLMSDIYNENDEWITSSRYYNGFFDGPGNESGDIKIGIKDSYRSFFGEAKIKVRIREEGSTSYKKEIEKTIDILKAKEETTENENTPASVEETKTKDTDSNKNPVNNPTIKKVTGNFVKIDSNKTGSVKSESIKTSKNTIYQSKNEIIKKYSIYSFVFLCVVLFILFFYNNKNKPYKEN